MIVNSNSLKFIDSAKFMTHSKVINFNGTRYSCSSSRARWSLDFTLWVVFRADFVVKFVIILLIASSIFSWALIFDKFKLFKSINKSTEDFEKKFWKAKSAESFNNNLPVNSKDPATLIFKAAMVELIKTKRQSSAIQSARVERILEIATDWNEFMIPQTVPNNPINGAVEPIVAK